MTPGDPHSALSTPSTPGTPHHRRTIVIEVRDAPEGLIEVAGRLRDELVGELDESERLGVLALLTRQRAVQCVFG